VSIDSYTQVRASIKEEVDEWHNFWSKEATYEEKHDLIQSIFDDLRAGGALDPALTETTDYTDERYNT
jgi:hypothetical protein